MSSATAQLVACLSVVLASCIQVSLFLRQRVCNGFGAHNVQFLFCLCIFLFFLWPFTFENERGVVGVSARKVENTAMCYNSGALCIIGIV
jgi:hypothetical protein